jgi:hypothetical protein
MLWYRRELRAEDERAGLHLYQMEKRQPWLDLVVGNESEDSKCQLSPKRSPNHMVDGQVFARVVIKPSRVANIG